MIHALSRDYQDTEWHRRRDGVELPDTSVDCIRRLCAGKPWSEWGGIRMSNDRTYYVLPSGKPVLKTTVARILGRSETEHRLLATYLSVPNGQVKNFLNACRGTVGVGQNAHVAVVGSKASEGGGVWHRYYALWLSLRCRSVIIDFYDYNEIAGSWEFETQGCQVSCEWIVGGVTTEYLNSMGYNVIIDDVWTYETGPGLVEAPCSQCYSRKFGDQVQGARPYLHPRECRLFSHPPVQDEISGCNCLVCSEIKQCCSTYDEYLFLRNMCSRLGYGMPCVGISYIGELVQVHSLRQKILTTGEYEITRSAEFRQIVALTEELAISLRGRFLRVIEGQPEYKPYGRFRTATGEFEMQTVPWLQGKTVLFCGVPSSILGSTNVRAVRGPQSPDMCDAVFFNSIPAWRMQFAARVVYVPASPAVVASEVPDWVHTGRKIRNFYEYVREEKVIESDRKMEPGQYWRGVKYPPINLAPVVDTTYVSRPLGNFVKDFPTCSGKPELFSLVKEKWKMVVHPFSMQWWRQSVVVVGDQWTLVKLHIARLYDLVGPADYRFFRAAAVMLPWDMTAGEVLKVESSYPEHIQLRKHFLSGNPYYGKMVPQAEFGLRMSGCKSEPTLYRLRTAHPVSWTGVQFEEWNRLRQDWGNFLEYEQFSEIDED